MSIAYTPAEASERSGLTLDTLRYYEREGLVGPITRVSGQRRYSPDDLSWIGVVTCLRDAGLGIAHLQRFTELLRQDGGATGKVEFLRQRRRDLVEQADRLHAALRVLDQKIEHYGAT